jgi:mono/diheme cytochrome c family protein
MSFSKKLTKNVVAFVIALLFLFPFSGIAQDGEATFKNNCGSCHTIGKGRLVGPDLSGVTTKRPEAWLLKWVKSSTAFIASGDADAKALFDQFKIPMPDQKLTEPEMKAVFSYITNTGLAVAAEKEKAKLAVPPVIAQSNTPKTHAMLFENPLLYLYIFFSVFIVVVAYSVWNAKRILKQQGIKFDLTPAATYKKVSRVKSSCDIYATCSKFPGCSSWNKKEVLGLCPKGI